MMDTFFEQLISVKKSFTNWMLIVLMWAVVFVVAVLVMAYGLLGSLGFLVIFGLGYLAYKLTGKFSVEYEYIITNGSFDVDKITAKSDRKRVVSFELKDVDNIEKFNPSKKLPKDTVVACNTNIECYFLTAENQSGKTVSLVFAPNEKMKTAAKKFLPTYISNSAFK